MAALLLGCVALGRSGLGGTPLPSTAGKRGLAGQQQEHLHAASALMVAAVSSACDGLAPVAEVAAGGAGGTTMVVYTGPPRTNVRLVVPSYCLSGGTRTRRRGTRRGSSDDDELGGGGGGSDGFWGGDDGSGGGGDFWSSGGGGEPGEGGSSLAPGLQDLLLAWGIFCTLAFGQTVYHVTPKPKGAAVVPPAFAALSYSGIKAQLFPPALRAS
jgi:hypothetical protein